MFRGDGGIKTPSPFIFNVERTVNAKSNNMNQKTRKQILAKYNVLVKRWNKWYGYEDKIVNRNWVNEMKEFKQFLKGVK